MKIGILTFHRAKNYGAILQCYALQEYLKSLGHNVEVIDYIQPIIESQNQLFRFIGWKNIFSPKQLYWELKKIKERYLRIKNFKPFYKEKLNKSRICKQQTIPKDYDIYIIGSDQLWNPTCMGGKIDLTFWGDFHKPQNSKIIGYAISGSDILYKVLKEDNIKQLIVKNFDSLTVREETFAISLKNHIGIEPVVTIDPTLLVKQNVWDRITNKKWNNKKYIVVYQVRGTNQQKAALCSKANKIAKKSALQYIDLSSSILSPEDFVSAIKHAQYVITSSFHATVFSLIYEKQFIPVMLNDGNDHRYSNLLESIGINHILIGWEQLQEKEFDIINYDKAKNKLEQKCKISYDFLQNIRL